MTKEKIRNCTMQELVAYLEGANSICRYYENTIKTYNGTFNTTTKEYSLFQKYNNIRLNIIEVLCEKLDNIEC